MPSLQYMGPLQKVLATEVIEANPDLKTLYNYVMEDVVLMLDHVTHLRSEMEKQRDAIESLIRGANKDGDEGDSGSEDGEACPVSLISPD